MTRAVTLTGIAAALVLLWLGALSGPAVAAGDPYCTADYAVPVPTGLKRLRFGIDPGLAGSFAGVQLPSVPDDPARDLAAVKLLRPAGKVLVVRLNRLFWSGGQALIDAFRHSVSAYTRAGDQVELQVRYHPGPGEEGNLAAWRRYVRHVVDTFGPNRRVVAMTITNEVNVSFSPNTSDGAYAGARDALIEGIEAAHAEARRRGFGQLHFGFTYAYRFSPPDDAAFFTSLATRGGAAFRRALGFVGLDFYPGSVYPPALAPGDSYGAEMDQALGVLRRCFMVKADLSRRVPIWVTENGVPTGATLSDATQAAALRQLVRAAAALAHTLGVTDYRWFNLRDTSSTPLGALPGVAATFATDGLLRSDYSAKPSFAAYRSAIASLGRAAGRPARPRR